MASVHKLLLAVLLGFLFTAIPGPAVIRFLKRMTRQPCIQTIEPQIFKLKQRHRRDTRTLFIVQIPCLLIIFLEPSHRISIPFRYYLAYSKDPWKHIIFILRIYFIINIVLRYIFFAINLRKRKFS